MLQKKHSAILSTFIKLPVVIKTLVLSIFEWPFYTGFTVHMYSVFVCSESWLYDQIYPIQVPLAMASCLTLVTSSRYESRLHVARSGLKQQQSVQNHVTWVWLKLTSLSSQTNQNTNSSCYGLSLEDWWVFLIVLFGGRMIFGYIHFSITFGVKKLL